jgi:hypothetical protein
VAETPSSPVEALRARRPNLRARQELAGGGTSSWPNPRTRLELVGGSPRTCRPHPRAPRVCRWRRLKLDGGGAADLPASLSLSLLLESIVLTGGGAAADGDLGSGLWRSD